MSLVYVEFTNVLGGNDCFKENLFVCSHSLITHAPIFPPEYEKNGLFVALEEVDSSSEVIGEVTMLNTLKHYMVRNRII